MVWTIAEKELLEGIDYRAKLAKRDLDASMANADAFEAARAEQNAPAYAQYDPADIPTVWAEVDYDGRVRRCLVFTEEAAKGRLDQHNEQIHPKPSGKEGYVLTHLGKRREYLYLGEEVSVKEYLRRYHKWARRYGAAIGNRVTNNDRVVIRQVTVWSPGSCHWYFWLLGWRDRPLQRK